MRAAGTTQAQSIDSRQIDGLSAQFQRRWESVYHWRSMCSMLLGTPGLRGAWPMSSVDFAQPECIDISGQGNHLQAAAAIGNVWFGHDPLGIAPIANFAGGANNYLLRADGGAGNWADLAIAGGGLEFTGAQRGIVTGGWFWVTALPGAGISLMSKAGGAAFSYQMALTVGNNLWFAVWLGPISVTSINTIRAGWNHCVGIYDQTSQTVFVVLNGVTTAGAAGAAPATVADTGAAFTIGADNAGGTRFTGRASDCFLSGISLSQGFVRAGYHYTKAAYGVK